MIQKCSHCTLLLPATSWNADQFSKFFYWQTHSKCCNKIFIKYPFPPHLKHVAVDGVEIPTGKGNSGGLSDSLNSFRGLCCGVCCKRDDSVLNEGMTARLLQPTAMLPVSHITFSPVKNPPPSYAAFRQNSSITCYFYLLVYLLTTSALMNIGAILHEFAYNLPLQRLVLVWVCISTDCTFLIYFASVVNITCVCYGPLWWSR